MSITKSAAWSTSHINQRRCLVRYVIRVRSREDRERFLTGNKSRSVILKTVNRWWRRFGRKGRD